MSPKFMTFEDKERLKQAKPYIFVDDHVNLAFDELFDIQNPAKKDSKTNEEVSGYAAELTGHSQNDWGVWVYYPWLQRIVHTPPKDKLRMLRTSRNRNLITVGEQKKLYAATILIIGMSVGSNVVEALVSQGIASKLILSDTDIIEPSNLNRIRSPYYHAGLHKIDAIARKVWEIDPYIDIVQYRDGLSANNIDTITSKDPVDIIIDEMDELRMKIALREKARQLRKPVLMAADDGDNALVDIERYDLEPDLELFNGLVPPDVIGRIKNEKLSRAELGLMIGRYFVGPKNIPLRMYRSLDQVGKTLPSWPQLGGAAALSGITLAYLAKKILLGQKINDGRILLSLDEKFDLARHDEAHQAELKSMQDRLVSDHSL